MSDEKVYRITLENDKTLKQMVERYYLIPREPIGYSFSEKEKEFLQSKALYPTFKEVKEGKNGYIVFRKNIKKITDIEELEEIKADTRPVRAIAKEHAVSIATISKIKNDKY